MTDVTIAHERAFELLPWLVNGTLSTPERDTVEAHVRDCIVCRREIRDQRRLQAALRAQPAVHLSAPMDFGRFAAAVDEERNAQYARARFFEPALRFGTVGALGLALVALLFWLAPQNADRPGAYTTLATSPETAAQIDVVFVADTTAAEIQRLLDGIGGEIVAGPSEIGRYSIRINEARGASDGVERAIETLTADPHVRFASRTLDEGP